MHSEPGMSPRISSKSIGLDGQLKKNRYLKVPGQGSRWPEALEPLGPPKRVQHDIFYISYPEVRFLS
jgi:hypothetical protein